MGKGSFSAKCPRLLSMILSLSFKIPYDVNGIKIARIPGQSGTFRFLLWPDSRLTSAGLKHY